MEQLAYGGWEKALRITSGEAEIIATTEVGPRLIRLALAGGENLFHEMQADMGATGGTGWRLYGGHRLWHGPEDRVLTYEPDNDPVEVEELGGGAVMLRAREAGASSGLQKELRVEPQGNERFRMLHRLTNRGSEAVRRAPWALTVMAAGTRALIPQERFAPHPEALLPARPLVLWPYVHMDDPRWTWGSHLIQLQQRAGGSSQKIGVRNGCGWMAGHNKGVLFIKRHQLAPDAEYADFGCNLEVFTNDFMLELETLGPLQTIAPGESMEHEEVWSLHAVEALPEDEGERRKVVEALV